MEYFTRDNSLLRSERFRYHISRSADLLRGILKKMEPKCEKEKLTRNKYILANILSFIQPFILLLRNELPSLVTSSVVSSG